MSSINSLPQGFHNSAFSCETLFIQPDDSEFYQCLTEGLKFVERYPEVLGMIERDQDQHGLQKKLIRELDRISEHQSFGRLEFVDDDSIAMPFELETLKVGRPRMNPLTVFIYLLAEAYLGGSTTNRHAANYLADSQTIFAFLTRQQIRVPGASTIHDNLRCLSASTIETIFDLQLKMIREDEMDSFEKVFIDSTSVSANSSWPTDSGMMHGLAKRALLLLTRLHKMFGSNFADKKLTEWLDLFDKIDFQISLVRGKVNAVSKRKKLYRQLFDKVGKFMERATKRMRDFRIKHKDSQLSFSERRKVVSKVDLFSETLSDLLYVHEYSNKRVLENVNLSSREKILSLSDGDAAFIIKGGRDTVLGYKPQVAVSENMFVTSVLVPEGNAADSDMLMLSVDDSMERTGVKPRLVSTDDGYVSRKNLEELRDLDVEVISFGGSKGKNLLDEKWEQKEYLKARNDRSKAESIMFSLKHLFNFGQLQRRGADEVREELTMKAVIYNFYHIAKKKRTSEVIVSVA